MYTIHKTIYDVYNYTSRIFLLTVDGCQGLSTGVIVAIALVAGAVLVSIVLASVIIKRKGKRK